MTPYPCRRPLAGGCALAAIAVLATACGSVRGPSAAGGSSSSQPAAAPTVARTVTTRPPAHSPGPAASPARPAASTDGLAPCPAAGLAMKLGPAQGAMGSFYQTLVFTNTGAAACTLYGYPGVSLTSGTAAADQVGPAAAENPGIARVLVTLAPGASAQATLRIVDALNYPKSRCGPRATSYIQVYPPGQRSARYLYFRSANCTSLRSLGIGSLRSGS